MCQNCHRQGWRHQGLSASSKVRVRPASLLRLSLLRFVDSRFPGYSQKSLRIPPLKSKIVLESNPLRSRILVRRLAAPFFDACATAAERRRRRERPGREASKKCYARRCWCFCSDLSTLFSVFPVCVCVCVPWPCSRSSAEIPPKQKRPARAHDRVQLSTKGSRVCARV